MWPFTRTGSGLSVLLEMYDGSWRIAPAVPSQGGYVATWSSIADPARERLVLLEGGEVRGDGMVKSWRPHHGWCGDEFATWPEGCRFGEDN